MVTQRIDWGESSRCVYLNQHNCLHIQTNVRLFASKYLDNKQAEEQIF